MQTENSQMHTKCPYNDNVELPLIKIHKFAPTNSTSSTIYNNLLIFIVEGNVRYTMGNQREVAVKKGDFLLIPQGWTIDLNISEDLIIMAFRLLDRVSFCERYVIEQLFEDVNLEREQMTSGGSAKLDKEQLQSHVLKINTPIWNYLWSLYSSISDGLVCRKYFEIKIKELLYLMKEYYHKDQLYELFNPVASADTLFSDYVRHNYHKYKTVTQLAASMNLSYGVFLRKFNKIFNKLPYQWIIEQRSEVIYSELTRSNKNLKQIAFDFGFLSPAQLNDFCKHKWGRTPGSIRKGASVEIIKKQQ